MIPSIAKEDGCSVKVVVDEFNEEEEDSDAEENTEAPLINIYELLINTEFIEILQYLDLLFMFMLFLIMGNLHCLLKRRVFVF